MMLNPAIGKLINYVENTPENASENENENALNSRYDLVLEIAKRARRISEKAQRDGAIIIDKPVTLAMNELAKEKNL